MTKTKLFVAAIALLVAVFGFFSLAMANGKSNSIADRRATQAEYEQKIVDLKPKHAKETQIRDKANENIAAIESEANGYRAKISEIETSIQADLSSEKK